MCNPLELTKQKQETMLTATQQLHQERKERTMTSPEAFEQKFETLKDQLLSYRREQYEMGQVKDMVLERDRTERRQPAPPVSMLTDRQRRKVASKRENNLKKAQKKHIPGASADTLPMQEAVKSFYKDVAKNGIQNTGTFGFDAKLFSPDFPEEQECSIDVQKGMTTLMKLKKAKVDFDADHSGFDDFKIIASRSNFLLIDPLENALRTLLAANGIDMATGALIRDEQVVAEAQQMQREAIAAYERAMANVSSTFGDVMEEHLAPKLAEARAQYEYSDKEMLKGRGLEEDTADLDFVPANYEQADEIVKLRKSIDSHPEQYAAHKEAIDQSYQLYLDAQKKLCDFARRMKSFPAAATEYGLNSALGKQLNNRAVAVETSPEKEHMEFVATQQYELIRFLLEGRPFSDGMQYMYKVVEEQFGIQTEQRAYQKHEQAVYATLDKEQKEVANMLFPEQRMQLFRATETMQEDSEGVSNSMAANETLLEHTKKDKRVIRSLLHGAKVNATGAPINVEEGRHMLEDHQRIQAYLSNDPAISGPLLAPIVEEVLTYPYLEIDLNKELWENPVELHSILNRNVYMQNMISDHPEYFDNLPQEIMEKLDAIMVFGAAMSVTACAIASAKGMEFNEGVVYNSTIPVKNFKEQLPEYYENFYAHKEILRQALGN